MLAQYLYDSNKFNVCAYANEWHELMVLVGSNRLNFSLDEKGVRGQNIEEIVIR